MNRGPNYNYVKDEKNKWYSVDNIGFVLTLRPTESKGWANQTGAVLQLYSKKLWEVVC